MKISTQEASMIERARKDAEQTVLVRNLGHLSPNTPPSICYIAPGEVGLVSNDEYRSNNAWLRKVECPEWDSEGFKPGDVPKKKAKAKSGEEAPEKP